MENNQFFCMNNIIYQIYNISDFNGMRLTSLNLIKTLIPNSCASILMANNGGSENLLCDPVCVPENLLDMEENYLSIEQEDFSRWTAMSTQPVVVRGSDLLEDKKRVETALYKICFEPYGLHYSLEMCLAREEHFLGLVTLYRTKDQGDFSDDEVFLFRCLNEHLSSRFYREYLSTLPKKSSKSNSLNATIHQYGLTEREAQVLAMVLEEIPTSDISDALCISPHTLKKHMQNLYHKLGVSSRFQLLKFRD